jgi:DNA-binding winged helix-turn-helix (wHTH) protein
MGPEDEAANQHPRLRVHGPDGRIFLAELRGERLTIGRLPDCNDVALQPDPEHLIGRQTHCWIERDCGSWWIVDNYSVNGTFLLRDGHMQAVRSRLPLADGDVIRILAGHGPAGALFWELALEDPYQTRPAVDVPHRACIEFDRVQQELFFVVGSTRQRINLRPQERALVHHLAQRNEESGYRPTMCSYDELMAAIWGDSFHVKNELFHLVAGLRRKVGRAAGVDLHFIETVPGSGYRLHSCRELSEPA